MTDTLRCEGQTIMCPALCHETLRWTGAHKALEGPLLAGAPFLSAPGAAQEDGVGGNNQSLQVGDRRLHGPNP